MDADVKIQVRGWCPATGNVDEFRNACNFIAATVERIGSGMAASVATFDPLTGEPYFPTNVDSQAIRNIGSVSVASPHAMMLVLSQQQTMDEGGHDHITIEPIFFDTAEVP